MNKTDLIKEQIGNLKDFRHTLMLAFIALTGGLGTIFIYFADVKSRRDFILKSITFAVGFIVDIFLFSLIKETNIDIQKALNNLETKNNE